LIFAIFVKERQRLKKDQGFYQLHSLLDLIKQSTSILLIGCKYSCFGNLDKKVEKVEEGKEEKRKRGKKEKKEKRKRGRGEKKK